MILESVPKWNSRAQALTIAFTSEITSRLLDLASIHKPDTVCTLKQQQWEPSYSCQEPDMGKGTTALASFYLKLTTHPRERKDQKKQTEDISRRSRYYFPLDLPKPQNKDPYTIHSLPPSVPVASSENTIKKRTKLHFGGKCLSIFCSIFSG